MPYNPQVQPIPIHADLSNWGAALVHFLDQHNAESQKIKEGDALAKAYYKYLTPPESADGSVAANPMKITPDAWNAMSSRDRIAAMQTHAQQSAVERAMQEYRLRKAELESTKRVKDAQMKALNRAATQGDALARAMQEAGTKNSTLPSPSAPGLLPPLQFQTSVQPTAERLSAAMAQHFPDAANSPQAVRLLEAMQKTGDRSPKGLTFMKSPTGADIALSPDTGAFQYDPLSTASSRLQMTDYQKAELVNKARERYISAKRQFDSLGAMKDDQFAQSLLPGAQEAMQAAQEELKTYGVNMGQNAPANEVTRYVNGKAAIFDSKTKKFLRYAE